MAASPLEMETFLREIIASKEGLRYALQCKAGQSTSGVKAIQEAAAGSIIISLIC
jgi:HJR/Mrr/RecB family endonuclease